MWYDDCCIACYYDDAQYTFWYQDRAPEWKTKDGIVMLIMDMTDLHLANAIRMVRRGRGGVDYPPLIAEAQHRKLEI